MEPDPTHDNPKYPCGKYNLNITKKTIKQFNVIHVTIGIILNVMELTTPNMKSVRLLQNL